ncbi:hypothetical protein [Bradyrhizobium sp. USDA 3262]|nr:hypothetical protein QIH80_22730 [Bradyrhizobium elkanii]
MTDNTDLVGRIAGMAMAKLEGMKFFSGIYFKATEVGGGEVKAVCTNPGLRLSRSFPAHDFRRQLQLDTIQGQLEPLHGENLDYTAKCYETERQADENDEQLKARLTALGLGPTGMN